MFLNAGAHIQHHYFYNSSFVTSPKLKNPGWYINEVEDPFFEMLKVYDRMVQDLVRFPNTEIIIATGLSQKPYEQVKFYYRIKNHEKFLSDLGVSFSSVVPRMTRDFLVTFESTEQAVAAAEKLGNILVNGGIKLFEEIDNRGKDLFIVLTYPDEVFDETTISSGGWTCTLSKYVTFVAVKNGEHHSRGFAYFSGRIAKYAPACGSHVSKIHNTVLDFFSIPN